MKHLLCAGLLPVIVAVPAAAYPRPEHLEVAGVRLGQERDAVEAALTAQDYRLEQVVTPESCSSTYEDVVTKLAQSRAGLYSDFISCQRKYAKGTSRVNAVYLLSPSGWKVGEMLYSFNSNDSLDSGARRYAARLGTPSEGWGASSLKTWWTASDLDQSPFLRYTIDVHGRHNIELNGGRTFRNTFFDETKKELNRRRALAAAVAAPPASSSFPASMQAAWAQSLSDCQPEFTGGFEIRCNEVSYYDGPSTLLSHGPITRVKTPSGPGQTMVARIRFQENDNPAAISKERFTVAGKWLYHGHAEESLAKHLSPKNRMVRCPTGSTD